MGGLGSGSWYRWRKKIYVDDCRSIDINRMRKLEAILDCGSNSGGWAWMDSETGEQISSISYEANTLDTNNAYLRLYYTITQTEQKIDYKIKIDLTKPNYGGERLWFICPITGRRVSKLYLHPSSDMFASRQAYGLSYASQSECILGRATRKAHKIESKLKNKRMHKRTFEKLERDLSIVDYKFNTLLLNRFGIIL